MERFCDKCGTLVSGEGSFCPNCGATLPAAVTLDKPVMSDPMPNQSAPNYYGGQTNQAQQSYNPNQAQMPVYPQNYNNAGIGDNYRPMTVGSWVGTLILSSLGIIGLIFLFIWAFDSSTPQPKKNFARGYLVVMAISLGIAILFTIISFTCTGYLMQSIFDSFGDYSSYYNY